MAKFTNGPAANVMLNIRRAPLFLRVVRDTKGQWDALDQLSDTPEYDETIYAYRLTSNDGMIHINSRDRKTGSHTGGFFVLATYEVVDPQPDDATMRSNKKWSE